MSTRPRITAADLAGAATRLLGTVVLDLADLVVGPAVYVPRLQAFASIEDTERVLASVEDDSIVVLVLPGTARDLIEEHGTPGRAADAVNRRLRAEGVL
jgi:hypothetical protein